MPAGAIELTANEILNGIYHYAQEARRNGIADGDTVLIVPSHGVESLLTFLGLIGAGAIPCYLPYRTNRRDSTNNLAREIASTTRAKWLVMPEFDSVSSDALGADLQQVVLARADQANPAPEVEFGEAERDIAYLQLTSGTTSRSKAIAVTHQAALNNIVSGASRGGFTAADVFVGWLPLNHDMGLVSLLLTPLVIGSKSVMLSPQHWISNPVALLDAIDQFRGTITHMPNFAFDYIARKVPEDHVARLDLSTWRYVVNGAETVRSESIESFMRLARLGGAREDIVAPAYGMGENVLAVTMSDPGKPPRTLWISARELERSGRVVTVDRRDPDAIAVVSCGRLIDGTWAEVRSDRGDRLPSAQAGSIFLFGDSLCSHYLTDPPQAIESERGFDTGDIGFIDDDEVFICGRKKEIAIVAGRNINVSVISAIVATKMGSLCRRSAAFSIYSEEVGTERLILVCEVVSPLSEKEQSRFRTEISEAVFESLDASISDIIFRTNNWLPRTTSGKVNIPKAKKKYSEYMVRQHGPVTGRPVLETVSTIAAATVNGRQLDPEVSLLEQGMDSLTVVETLSRVEQSLRVKISDAFFETPTIANLVQLVQTALESGPVNTQSTARLVQPTHRKLRSGRFGKSFLARGPAWSAMRPSYGAGVAIQRAIVTTRFSRRLFASELNLVKQFHRESGSSQPLEESLALTLLANTWSEWRDEALASPAASKWIVTSNVPTWLANGDDRQGVVLVLPHALKLGRSLHQYVGGQSARSVGSLNGSVSRAESSGPDDHAGRLRSRARQLWNGRSLLSDGGIFIIAGDGRAGDKAIETSLLGRPVRFRVGPAELAISTRSRFLPAFLTISWSGVVHFRYRPDLCVDTSVANINADDLTRLYAEAYIAELSDTFSSLEWGKLKHLLTGQQ
jgi:acyl-CoA synthetase (AMP-forming)/AMP-acid ligase II/acyl carrier protein